MDEVMVRLSWHGIAVSFFIITLILKCLEESQEKEQIARLYEEEQKSSTIDHLTGLYNRRELERRIDEEVGRATRYGHALQVMLIDLDNFKKVNDTCGHAKGDEVLKKVANAIKQVTRRHDILSRYGLGDEFVLILPEISAESANNFGKRIIEIIEDIEINGSINISASVGISHFDPKNPAVDLIEKADNAMYIAKNGGKGKVHAHTN